MYAATTSGGRPGAVLTPFEHFLPVGHHTAHGRRPQQDAVNPGQILRRPLRLCEHDTYVDISTIYY